jgi:hypothetical protein
MRPRPSAPGVNPKIVSHRIGHASRAFTLHVYSHVTPGMDRDAADQVADLILGNPAADAIEPTTQEDEE